MVTEGEGFPADLVFLTVGKCKDDEKFEEDCANDTAYVETANIDGETNLKIKAAALPDFELSSSLLLECSPPDAKIYSFSGSLRLLTDDHNDKDTRAVALTIDNLFLRGSVLKNTPKGIWGLVVYTGEDTKIRCAGKDSTITPWYKRLWRIKKATEKPTPTLDLVTNQQLRLLCLVLLGLSLFAVFSSTILRVYSFREPFSWGNLIMGFFTYVILFHSLLPISFLVTVEVVRVKLAQLIEADLQMFTDTSGVTVRNSGLVDELGRVDYLFTDKTGTLTCNQMCLVQMATADGQIYKNLDERANSSRLDALLAAMSLCHSAIVKGDSLDVYYESASPDEVAILEGCRMWGYDLIKRQATSLTVVFAGLQQEYKILAVLEFNSRRKRMSVLLEDPRGQYLLVTKGAESVILERSPGSEAFLAALQSFSNFGLRSLCFAFRPNISAQLIDPWLDEWNRNRQRVSCLLFFSLVYY